MTVFVPKGSSPGTPLTLVVFLHGYGDTGASGAGEIHLRDAAATQGILFAAPDGMEDANGYRFWNATEACCDYGGSGVDDSSYLAKVITEIKADATVDPHRVFLVGVSNGGFMAYRMACDHADLIAAIVSIGGATLAKASECRPSSPVAVLEIHGTADEAVPYGGGTSDRIQAPVPGSVAGVAMWAKYDGCSKTPRTSHLAVELSPFRTTTDTDWPDCQPGGHAELWTSEKGGHVPTGDGLPEVIIPFLLAHSKP